MPAREAADRAITQVASALVAIVLSLCAVFVPVAFIGGVTGALFKQFAVTIVIAVVLSGIVALTLTPALCALLLTESNEANTTGFFGWFNRFFERGRSRYTRIAGGVLDRPRLWLAVLPRHRRARRPALAAHPDRLHAHRGQGLHGDRGAAARCRASLQRTEDVAQQVEASSGSSRRVAHFVALAGLASSRSRDRRPTPRRSSRSLKQWAERGPGQSADAISARSQRHVCSPSRAPRRSPSTCPRCRGWAPARASNSTCRTATARTSAPSRSRSRRSRRRSTSCPRRRTSPRNSAPACRSSTSTSTATPPRRGG